MIRDIDRKAYYTFIIVYYQDILIEESYEPDAKLPFGNVANAIANRTCMSRQCVKYRSCIRIPYTDTCIT